MTKFKNEIIADYAVQEGITKVEAEKRLEDILGLITGYLVAGDDVKVNNFFNFFVKHRDAKDGKNPITKEPMTIPAVTTVVARMTKPLKDRIQGKR
jgi:nucleoid DNA-binding protein